MNISIETTKKLDKLLGQNLLNTHQYADLRLKLLKLMEAEVNRVTTADVEARVAQHVLSLRETGKKSAYKGDFDFKQSQEVIAQAIGASRPYVSGLMCEWKAAGHIQSFGRTTCVRDAAALKKIAEGA